MNAITTQTAGNIALLDFNAGSGRWEAKFNGQVILSSQNKDYVIEKIVNQVSNKVKAAGVTDFKDISNFTAEMRQALIAGSEVMEAEEEEALHFTIHERFDFLADFVQMVGDRKGASTIITGSGGLGKSYTTYKTLEQKCGLRRVEAVDMAEAEPESEEDQDDTWEAQRAANRARLADQAGTYICVKGFSTAKGLYRTLYENRNRVIVFDDTDSILKDAVSSNILKSALDSYDRRIVTWNAEAPFGSDLPKSFEFTGGIVFISNLSMQQIPQALISRSFVADVSMTRDETVERMRVIAAAPEFMFDVDSEIKATALDFIAEHANRREVKELNMRTLIAVIKLVVANPVGWERRALYTMSSAR